MKPYRSQEIDKNGREQLTIGQRGAFRMKDRDRTPPENTTNSTRCYNGRTNEIVVKNNNQIHSHEEPNTLCAGLRNSPQNLETTRERDPCARRRKERVVGMRSGERRTKITGGNLNPRLPLRNRQLGFGAPAWRAREEEMKNWPAD
jgi:hypothetical protein